MTDRRDSFGAAGQSATSVARSPCSESESGNTVVRLLSNYLRGIDRTTLPGGRKVPPEARRRRGSAPRAPSAVRARGRRADICASLVQIHRASVCAFLSVREL